jgi:hypothetical protein
VTLAVTTVASLAKSRRDEQRKVADATEERPEFDQRDQAPAGTVSATVPDGRSR